jgi:hypothetical protein
MAVPGLPGVCSRMHVRTHIQRVEATYYRRRSGGLLCVVFSDQKGTEVMRSTASRNGIRRDTPVEALVFVAYLD